MEFEIPEEIEDAPNEDALLVALMEEIDSALETTEEAETKTGVEANAAKQAQKATPAITDHNS